MITEQPLFYDVSSHQGTIKYARLAEGPEIWGIISRAGCGLNKDVQFERNWAKCDEYSLYRSSYWACWHEYCMNTQLQKWYEINPAIDGIPRMIDLEHGGCAFEKIAEDVLHWSDVIYSRDGVRPWIYSSALLVEKWLTPFWSEEDLNGHYYILAQYDVGDGNEYDGVVLPDGVEIDNVLFKQTSGSTPPDPLSLAPDASAIDRDRWLHGDVDCMNDFLVSMYFTPIAPPDIDDDITKLKAEMLKVQVQSAANDVDIDTAFENIKSLQTATQANFQSIKNLVDGHTELTEDVMACEKKVNELELQNNHTHPAWMRKLGLVRQEER